MDPDMVSSTVPLNTSRMQSAQCLLEHCLKAYSACIAELGCTAASSSRRPELLTEPLRAGSTDSTSASTASSLLALCARSAITRAARRDGLGSPCSSSSFACMRAAALPKQLSAERAPFHAFRKHHHARQAGRNSCSPSSSLACMRAKATTYTAITFALERVAYRSSLTQTSSVHSLPVKARLHF